MSARWCILICLAFILLSLAGQAKPWDNMYIQQNSNDTIPKKEKPRKVKPKHAMPDTVKVGWENGKFQGPQNMPKDQLKDAGRDQADVLADKLKEKRRKSAPETALDEQQNKAQHKSDSVQSKAEQVSDALAQVRAGKIPTKKLYSDKKIKAMYDSLGISGMDSVLAVAKLKKPVSEDELLDKIHASLGKSNNTSLEDPSASLSKSRLRDEALSELTPLSGRNFKPDHRQIADSVLRKRMNKTHVDSLKLPDSITHVKGARIVSYSNPQALDSLKDYYKKFPSADSIVFMQSGRADSIKKVWLDKRLAQLARIDSLKSKPKEVENSYKRLIEKDALNQHPISDKLAEVPIETRPKFLDKFYFEGIVSFSQNSRNNNEFRLSPAFGFTVINNWSVAGGLNFLVSKEEKKIQLATGYRVFSKYEFFKQRAYAQLENWVDPDKVIDPPEGTKLTRHSILVGGGYVLKIAKRLGINAAVLYRVNNDRYSAQQLSPWVIRIGLSSIKSIKEN